MTVAENLKALRKKRKISQEQLEARSGVSQSGISSIERGERIPTIDTLQMLAKGLRVPVTELIEGSEKAAANEGDGIKQEIANLLLGLSDEELQHMREYAEFLVSRRGKQ